MCLAQLPATLCPPYSVAPVYPPPTTLCPRFPQAHTPNMLSPCSDGFRMRLDSPSSLFRPRCFSFLRQTCHRPGAPRATSTSKASTGPRIRGSWLSPCGCSGGVWVAGGKGILRPSFYEAGCPPPCRSASQTPGPCLPLPPDQSMRGKQGREGRVGEAGEGFPGQPDVPSSTRDTLWLHRGL